MRNAAPTKIKPYITALGKAELKEQLDRLRHERVKLIDEMRDLMSQSGTSIGLEDSLHALQKDRADELDVQIHSIEHIISTAKVITRPSSNDKVQLGSQVTVEIGGKRRTYTIVGSIEADPELGRISYESPLGKSLLDKRAQDRFEVTPLTGKAIVAKIIAIE